MKKLLSTFALLSISLFCCESIRADIVLSYDAGVSATSGTAGSADPTAQGWAANAGAGTTAFSHGLDSGNGGWRITDGTTARPFFYQGSISAGDVADMTSKGWIASFTVATNADAINSAGGGVDDYYDNGANQNNNAMWIEVAGAFRYILTFGADANNDLQISDGTSTFQITTANNQLSHELGVGAPIANFVTYTINYDGGTGNATLSDSLGGMHGVLADSGSATTSRVVWGATSSGGQGSTTWNNVVVSSVPEPNSILLLTIGLVGISSRRRRR